MKFVFGESQHNEFRGRICSDNTFPAIRDQASVVTFLVHSHSFGTIEHKADPRWQPTLYEQQGEN